MRDKSVTGDPKAEEQQEHQEDRGRQIRLTTEFADQIVLCTNLDDLCRRVVTLLHRFGYHFVQLLRYDPVADTVTPVAAYGKAGARLLADNHPTPAGSGLVGKAAMTGMSILCPDTSKDPDWQIAPSLLPDVRGELAVPIKLGKEDVDVQLKGLRYYINSGFDGFAVLPIEPAIIAPLAKQMLDKGRPVIVYSSDLGEGNRTALVSTADYDVGHLLGSQAGEWANKHIPAGETLKVGVLNQRPFVIQREDGIIEGIKGTFRGNVEVVGNETASDDPVRALPIVEGWLKTRPDLNMIVAIDDAGALGAYQAVVAAGKDDPDLFFVGGIDATDEALAAIRQGGAYQATVDQKPRETGTRVVRTLVAAIAGQPYQPVNTIECAPVNPNNIDEFLASRRAAVVEMAEEERALANMDLRHIKIGLSVLTLTNPYFAAVIEGARGEAERLGVELVVSESRPVWGVLDVQSDVAGSLDANDRLMLEGLCGLIAVAVEKQLTELDRERLLAEVQRHALQLQTAAEVSRAASSILDPDKLIQRVVDLIRERFGLYYAGLFLVDETGEWTGEPGKWAVLRAGTGQAGRQMLEGKHKLEIGGASMIGWCVANKQARIALDVGEEAVRFENPFLPETRSELALPLISRDHTIGALTIQSIHQAAFSDEDIAVLQTMADQLANAIENARLFAGRRRAEDEARQLSQFLDSVIDNADIWLDVLNEKAEVIIWNKAAEEISGYSRAEVMGHSQIWQWLYPDEAYRNTVVADAATVIETGEDEQGAETTIRRKDGQTRTISWNSRRLVDEKGTPAGSIALGRDITEVKRAEETLRENLSLLRTIIDATPDWIFVKDQQHRYRLVNQGYATALHLTPGDFIGKDDVEMSFPEDIVKGNPEKGIRGFWADDRQVMDGGEPLVNPHVPVTIDDQVHIFHDVKTPLRDAAGHVWGVLGLGRDVTERERLLADLERHSTELQAAAEISRAASSILDPGELIQRAVDLIRERFGLYYVGLFLVEETGKPGKWAVLRAGTGEAGRHMLESKHKLEIGSASTVGWCVANKQARIALDVGEEAVRFENPHLPETRSELALPLVSRGEAIGALTIQSSREAAFTEEDITILQTMADQLANAVENARLLERTQAALAEVEATQRRYLQQAWTDYTQAARSTGYETTHPGAAPLGDVVLPEIQRAIEQQHAMTLAEGGDEGQRRSALVAPIALRGEVIGVLGVHDDGARQWTDSEIALVEAVAERMAQTAENLRLLDETQRRARREQTLREITARVRGSSDPDTIVRTALRELGTTLGRPAFVRLGSAEQLRSPATVAGRSPAAVAGQSPEVAEGQDSATDAEHGPEPVEETQPSAQPTGRRRRGDRKSK
jgi:PAS domain S-box-containing protein